MDFPDISGAGDIISSPDISREGAPLGEGPEYHFIMLSTGCCKKRNYNKKKFLIFFIMNNCILVTFQTQFQGCIIRLLTFDVLQCTQNVVSLALIDKIRIGRRAHLSNQ